MMKFLGVLAILAVACMIVCTSADKDVAESDVVRVYNPALKLSKEELLKILKEANLEGAGFKKTEENTTETDENGKTSVKQTILFMVKDECSKAGFWEGVLEQRLPEELLSHRVASTFVREIQSRIEGRNPKYCKIGLEIHFKRCSSDSEDSKLTKRCWFWCNNQCNNCQGCNAITIVY